MHFTLYKHRLKRFIDWLLPSYCLTCHIQINAECTVFCESCKLKLPYLDNACSQCSQPFSGFSDTCGRCMATPPSFDECFCAFEYLPPISDEICRLKYANQPQLAKRLAALLADELVQREISLPEALAYVPMHSSSLRRRGFNQSYEIAKHLSKRLNLPLVTASLSKTRATKRQATVTFSERKKNLKNSFSITKPIGFKHIAIIDDVVTTGATAEEIAKIIKKNGVDYLQVWGIARTR